MQENAQCFVCMSGVYDSAQCALCKRVCVCCTWLIFVPGHTQPQTNILFSSSRSFPSQVPKGSLSSSQRLSLSLSLAARARARTAHTLAGSHCHSGNLCRQVPQECLHEHQRVRVPRNPRQPTSAERGHREHRRHRVPGRVSWGLFSHVLRWWVSGLTRMRVCARMYCA